MKKILLLVLIAICSFSANAQDIMVRMAGGVEKVKVIEVTPTEVKYQKSDSADGSTHIEKVSNIYYIRYQDGRLLSFNAAPEDKEINHFNYYSKEIETAIVYTKQFDIHIQENGWGVGLMLRKEITPSFGWNIAGVSFLSGWNDPKDFGVVNVRLSGIRYHSPAIDAFRFYGELNLGYTYMYLSDIETPWGTINGKAHCFGLDTGAGFQLSKNLAIGYNANFVVNSNGKALTHWARISILF